MGSDNENPDWSLLPHDPQRFFALDDGYDRKDLKRSYNRWIRRFKPETHPAEFQRIRAAFEALDRDLRYGGSLHSERAMIARDSVVAWSAAVERSDAADRPTAPHLHERAAKEAPAALYAELRAQADKTPYDYYALAVLSDLCTRKEDFQFYRWLEAGIRRHPGDYGLLSLLQAYFRGPVPTEALPKLLLAAAKAIGNDAFYPVTEPGWDQLLRAAPLETFVAALRTCESHLRDVEFSGKMAFTIRALRTAQWRAASAHPSAVEWTREAMEFVESNFEQIPHAATFEVDLLGVVNEYLAVRDRFVAQSSVHADLDQALQRFFIEDAAAADQAIVEQQLRLASDPAKLLNAFPTGTQQEEFPQFYPIWAWVSQEVASRYSASEDEPDETAIQMWARRSRALLVQFEATAKGSARVQLARYSGCGYLLIMATAFASVLAPLALYTLNRSDGDSISAATATLLLLSTMGLGVAVLLPRRGLLAQIRRFYALIHLRLGRSSYETAWRREVLELLSRSRLPFELFRQLFEFHAEDDVAYAGWVAHFVAEDYALAIYALALPYEI